MLGVNVGLLFAILIWVVCTVACNAIANGKGRSGCAWSLAGLMFGPFAILVVAAMPADQDAIDEAAVDRGAKRRCIHCAEAIRHDAPVCRFCGRDNDPLEAPGFLERPASAVLTVGLIFFGLLGLVVMGGHLGGVGASAASPANAPAPDASDNQVIDVATDNPIETPSPSPSPTEFTDNSGRDGTPQFTPIRLVTGINRIPNITGTGEAGTITLGWRENGNAWGYDIYTVSVHGSVVTIDDKDYLTDTPHTGDDMIRSVRFARGVYGGQQTLFVLVATRSIARSAIDPARTTINIYVLAKNDGGLGTPYEFRAQRTFTASSLYCNADAALLTEVGLPLTRSYSGAYTATGC